MSPERVTHLLPGVVNDQHMSHSVLVRLILVVLQPEPLQPHVPPALPGPVHLGWWEGHHGADELEGVAGVLVVSVGVPGGHRGQV